MTNEERRTALNLARKNALTYAQALADLSPTIIRVGAVDGPVEQVNPQFIAAAEQAKVWAAVAEAMKDGDPVHDAPDGRPINNHLTLDGSLTR